MAAPSIPDHRRKWDVNEYERLARERLKEDESEEEEEDQELPGSSRRNWKEPKPKRELLKPRDEKLDLESRIGKSVVINKTSHASEGGGYYCEICDCLVKDSINYLDHINGKKHQRYLGMSMKVKKSTLEDVKARFTMKKEEKEKKKKEYDFKERAREIAEEEQKLSAYRKQKKMDLKKRKRDEGDLEDQMDPDMANMMGFGGFGTSKKPK